MPSRFDNDRRTLHDRPTLLVHAFDATLAVAILVAIPFPAIVGKSGRRNEVRFWPEAT